MGWNEIKEFRRKRDAVLLAFALCVAITGLFAALHDTRKIERPDWADLKGTVVDKRLKAQDDGIYGGNVQAILTIETDSGVKIETRVPMSLYQDARIGDWVEGSKKTLKFYPRSPVHNH